MSDGTTLKPRIWHSSRDAYHCAFRLLRLLHAADKNQLELERLRALDLLLLLGGQSRATNNDCKFVVHPRLK